VYLRAKATKLLNNLRILRDSSRKGSRVSQVPRVNVTNKNNLKEVNTHQTMHAGYKPDAEECQL